MRYFAVLLRHVPAMSGSRCALETLRKDAIPRSANRFRSPRRRGPTADRARPPKTRARPCCATTKERGQGSRAFGPLDGGGRVTRPLSSGIERSPYVAFRVQRGGAPSQRTVGNGRLPIRMHTHTSRSAHRERRFFSGNRRRRSAASPGFRSLDTQLDPSQRTTPPLGEETRSYLLSRRTLGAADAVDAPHRESSS
jgi:hypothetical protein